MRERWVLIGWFCAGVVLQSVVLAKEEWKDWRLPACILIGLLMLIVPNRGDPLGTPERALVGLFAFALMYAFLFEKELLPVLNDRVVLSYTLLFWYAFLTSSIIESPHFREWVWTLIGPTAGTFYVAVSGDTVSKGGKIALYGWFLCLVVGLGLLQFSIDELSLFDSDRNLPWFGALDCVLGGMAFLYLAINATYLFYLLPIPGKSQSWADRMREWHGFTDLMTQRYDGDPPRLQSLLVILIGEGGVLLLNAWTQWLPRGLLISALIVLPGVVVYFRPPPGKAMAEKGEVPEKG
ncbi:MAG TPA: hypothetical protein VK130_04265 [Steroidobacteraceae bacterium]|nr:hypothetical protein [Steroidobacteraceae bacterium]